MTPTPPLHLPLPALLRIALLGAGLAALLAGTVATTSSFDWTLGAKPASGAAGGLDAAAPSEVLPPEEPARARCDECGTVESVRHVDSRQVITVRMRDGTLQSFEEGASARWRPGERAIVITGRGPAD